MADLGRRQLCNQEQPKMAERENRAVHFRKKGFLCALLRKIYPVLTAFGQGPEVTSEAMQKFFALDATWLAASVSCL